MAVTNRIEVIDRDKAKGTMTPREIMALNVDFTCTLVCESCEHFFECNADYKWDQYNRRRMSKARDVMSKISTRSPSSAARVGSANRSRPRTSRRRWR